MASFARTVRDRRTHDDEGEEKEKEKEKVGYSSWGLKDIYKRKKKRGFLQRASTADIHVLYVLKRTRRCCNKALK